ncbi:MAG: helix-turn-helix transcriptional regulator [Phycisphaeraceae bacterium]|nr:helix-turn-helix transcriptional regulator [Phycisphaeraceae bacterium]
MDRVKVKLDDREYVILPRAEYDRLAGRAKAADMPPLPKADRAGNVPAVDYARASLARKIISRRTEAGLNQRQLAKLAGIAFEQLNRIERGKVTPTLATIESIERGFRKAKGISKRRS